jgi:hypothetical protein
MDILRCQSSEFVRKAIWTRILAYNLIRTIIAQAAAKHEVEPRTISFKGAIQTLEAFQPVIAMQASYNAALRRVSTSNAIVLHRIADRPDRFEPGRRKRHSRRFLRFLKPRHEAKRDMANGVRDK